MVYCKFITFETHDFLSMFVHFLCWPKTYSLVFEAGCLGDRTLQLTKTGQSLRETESWTYSSEYFQAQKTVGEFLPMPVRLMPFHTARNQRRTVKKSWEFCCDQLLSDIVRR